MIDLIHPIPAFTDNYIWTLVDRQRKLAVVVDPGDAGPVDDYLASQGLTLVQILITHHHPDHTGGLPQLTAAHAPDVIGPDNPRIKGITRAVHEGDTVEVLGTRFSIFEVPGHTLDHIAFFASSHSGQHSAPALFCGDTLFAAGCGRLFEGRPEQMYESLGKLSQLPADTLVYCTHEYTLANLKFARAADPENEELEARVSSETRKREHDEPTLPSTIALELATNPFLRCSDHRISQQVHQHHAAAGAETASDPVATFSALRQWKDNF